ncbi:ribonuclease P protein component [Aneurinibacillus sp. Ricciae_BoGa-3]|uniref:ribonuclease P protein component n=1 Tax=Aneurinibacillus sp. Ricciae_BoGa-3 TaxID=3022697 RepID=UPI0023403CBE|nr:ribonuclease P protein component [Aneurinibacillus sp. Ricciae_BoGa-3]WCK54524.1 ribonuclease P protein component [Aneurinibacillus sp. Ricciae_BoGa-3]
MYRENRLRKNEEFQEVFKKGKSIANRQFVVYFMEKKDQDSFRVGVSVSKKMGNAVTRNRIRRYIKEAIRARTDEMKPSYDVIVICRLPAVELEYAEFRDSLYHCLRKAKLFTTSKKQGNIS